MVYWVSLSLALVCLTCSIAYIVWEGKIGYQCADKGDLITVIIVAVISLFVTINLSIDLPSALSGGEKIYVGELPERQYFGQYISYVITDNEDLRHLKGGAWDKYDKYGNYCIRYTKFIKIVLDIEKLD